MPGFSGRELSWLMASSTRLEPYAPAPMVPFAMPILSERPAVAVPHALVDKVDRLVQAAYDAGDRGAGRRLATALRNLQDRAGRGGPSPSARDRPPDGPWNPVAANDP
jgi:hypothetical protein